MQQRTAIALLRTSTTDQTNGVEAQRAEIERFAAAHAITVVAWHEEHVSGGAEIDARPVLLESLAALRALRCSVLLVQRRDRLARDPVIAAMIEREVAKARAVVVCADGFNGTGPGDELVRGIFDVVSRFERRMISARTSAAMQAMKRRGVFTGGRPPFGYQVALDGEHIEPHEDEQRVITRVMELRNAGESIRGIVAALTSEGFASRAGKPLGKTQVERIVTATTSLDDAG